MPPVQVPVDVGAQAALDGLVEAGHEAEPPRLGLDLLRPIVRRDERIGGREAAPEPVIGRTVFLVERIYDRLREPHDLQDLPANEAGR